MRRIPQTLILAVAAGPALFVLGCDSSRPTMPTAGIDASALSASLDRGQNRVQPVTFRDDCDPATFNAALGANTCVRAGNGMPLDKFIAELTENQSVGAWKMDPNETDATPGTILIANNRGGETHTFTRVVTFGGGVVPLLNDLSGNPVPAAECSSATPLVPGGSQQAIVANDGTERFQCCIHPWMRLEVHQHHS